MFTEFADLDEQAFCYNERKDALGDRGRFMKVPKGCAGKRLTYIELIGKSKATVDRV